MLPITRHFPKVWSPGIRERIRDAKRVCTGTELQGRLFQGEEFECDRSYGDEIRIIVTAECGLERMFGELWYGESRKCTSGTGSAPAIPRHGCYNRK